MPFLSHLPRLSDAEVNSTMHWLRELRLEVAIAELEAELRRSKIYVLRPRGVGKPKSEFEPRSTVGLILPSEGRVETGGASSAASTGANALCMRSLAMIDH